MLPGLGLSLIGSDGLPGVMLLTIISLSFEVDGGKLSVGEM